MKDFLKKVAAFPIWKRLATWFLKFIRFVREPFNTPKFHGFEIVWMRVLLAIVVFQTMPLGAPYSNWSYNKLKEAKPDWFEKDGSIAKQVDEKFRPPFLPLKEVLLVSDNPPRDVEMKKRNGFAHWAPYEDTKPGVITSVRKIFDFTIFADKDFVKILPWLVIPALLLYASGVGLPIALPILTWVSIGSRTLFNSQGSIHHGYQMLSLVLLAQTVYVLWHCTRNWREAFGIKRARLRNGVTMWDHFTRYAQIVVVACYCIAGLIKPIKSNGEWFANSHMIGIQVVKTDRQNYYSDLDAEQFNKEPVPYAKPMMEHKNLSRIFLAMGVLLEIFAFIALFSRFWGLVLGISLISFHFVNDLIMNLYFFNNEKLVWIFLINIPFWIWWVWQKLRRRTASDALPIEVEGEMTAS